MVMAPLSRRLKSVEKNGREPLNKITMTALAAACSLMTACGGGGGDGGANGSPPPPSGPTGYPMVRPTPGTTSVYAETSVDDVGTSMQTSYRDVVQSVASDGSYKLHRDDPTGSGAIVDGVD